MLFVRYLLDGVGYCSSPITYVTGDFSRNDGTYGGMALTLECYKTLVFATILSMSESPTTLILVIIRSWQTFSSPTLWVVLRIVPVRGMLTANLCFNCLIFLHPNCPPSHLGKSVSLFVLFFGL
jgi:hypothetical protein